MPLSTEPLELTAQVLMSGDEVLKTAIQPGPFTLTVDLQDHSDNGTLVLNILGFVPDYGEVVLLSADAGYDLNENPMVHISASQFTSPREGPSGLSRWTEYYYGCFGGTCDWLQISAGDEHTCAIARNRRLYCWGSNAHGQLGTPEPLRVDEPLEVTGGAESWAQVSAGARHTCAISTAGELFCWGNNGSGQADVNDVAPRVTIPTPSWGSWQLVSAGDEHTCAINLNGDMYCWGTQANGRLGNGSNVSERGSDIVNHPRKWLRVSAGGHHTCAIDSISMVYCWGANTFGESVQHSEVGEGDILDPTRPLEQNLSASLVSTGQRHTCAYTASDRRVICWGNGERGQLGPHNTIEKGRHEIPLDIQVRSLEAGVDHTCFISTNGVECWGNTNHGKLGRAPDVGIADLFLTASGSYEQVTVGRGHTCYRSRDSMWCVGLAADGQLGNGTKASTSAPVSVRTSEGALAFSGTNPPSAIALGGEHTCVVADGIYCWGNNATGAALNPGGPDVMHPAEVYGMPATVVAAAAGQQHTCVLNDQGHVYCWGDNTRGQLGRGDLGPADDLVNVPCPDTGGWKSLAAGDHHTCAVAAAGSDPEEFRVYCWGEGSDCRIGSNCAIESSPVPTGDSYTQIPRLALGSRHTCIIDGAPDGGSLRCQGKLGPDELPALLTNIGTDADWLDIAAGDQFTCGIRDDGGAKTVWCFGKNDQGQVGQEPEGYRSAPTPMLVSGFSDVRTLAAGRSHVCAINTSDVLYCWGSNDRGQLGLDLSVRFVSEPRDHLFSWKKVSAGNSHTCAINTPNEVLCWGSDNHGQLGVLNTFVVAPHQVSPPAW